MKTLAIQYQNVFDTDLTNTEDRREEETTTLAPSLQLAIVARMLLTNL